MKRYLPFFLFAALAQAQGAFPAGDEVLHYDVKLPNGTAIGSATFDAVRVKGSAATWQFRAKSNFSLPGIPVEDTFRSLSAGFCSAEFEKDSLHGAKKSGEIVVFHPDKKKAVRTTKGGGMSEIPAAACAKDPVNVLYYTRIQLSKGQKPFTGSTIFGAAYDVKMAAPDKTKIKVQGREQQADRVAGSYRGPKSQGNFEIFFSRDEARTPLLFPHTPCLRKHLAGIETVNG